MAMDFSGNDFIGLGYGDSRTAANDESSNLSSSPLNRPQHYSGANFVRPQYPSHESNNREKVSAPNLSRWGPAKSTPTPKPSVLPQPQIDTTLDLTQRTQIARERALSVIQKFRENSELNLLSFDPTELSRKRRVCLDMLKERQQIALVKNFEYIARQEDQRLKQQLLNMQQAKDYQSQVEDYHSKQLERRYQHFANGKNYSMISHSQAGVGTEQRQRVENKRKHQTMAQDSASLYVSNLPTDGSVTEELMRALFGSYGRLRKIHFYIDKDTGHLKGDALVIFNTDDVDDKSKLLDAVCSQVGNQKRRFFVLYNQVLVG